MIVLASAFPLAHVEDGRVILSIPSGKKDRIEIALTVNQALFAHQALQRTAVELMNAHADETAEIIAFPTRRRKSRGA